MQAHRRRDPGPVLKITLDWYEVSVAAKIGAARQIQSLHQGKPDAHGRGKDNGWTDHIAGVAGEIACAKALDLYWRPSVNTFKVGGDVGKIQVRTRSRSNYQLIVRDNDDDDAKFVLVRGAIPHFDVVGWILGKDAKKDEYSQTHGGRPAAYFVPDEALTLYED